MYTPTLTAWISLSIPRTCQLGGTKKVTKRAKPTLMGPKLISTSRSYWVSGSSRSMSRRSWPKSAARKQPVRPNAMIAHKVNLVMASLSAAF